MSNPQITFSIEGSESDKGLVTIDEFAKFCDVIAKCLRRTESIVVDEDGERIRYRIVNLECASATVTLEAVRDKSRKKKKRDQRKEVVQFFRNTITGIQRGDIDPRISPDDLHVFRDLAEPLDRGASKVRIGGKSLSASYSKNIDKILTDFIPSEGFVSGQLERLNVHNKYEFILYPPISGRQVTCVFPAELLDKVREAIKRNVTVHGTLFFQPDSPFPDKANVRKLEIHPPDDELPTLHDVKRLGKWGTGGKNAVDFLRTIRSEYET